MKSLAVRLSLISFLCFYNTYSQSNVWVGAYLQTTMHVLPNGSFNAIDGVKGNNIKLDQIDWTAFDVLIHSAVSVTDQHLLRRNTANFTDAYIKDVLDMAHAHGKPVLLSIGGLDAHLDDINFAKAVPILDEETGNWWECPGGNSA